MADTPLRASALIVIGIVLLAAASAPGLIMILGWLSGSKTQSDGARELASTVGPLLSVLSLLLASYVAYQSWLSPFSPRVEVRPVVWRAGPGVPEALSISVFLTAFNEGALPGSITDLLVEVRFSDKRWVFEPRRIERASEFAQTSMKPEVKVPFDPSTVESFFTPIFLPGRTQTSKVVTFGPALGKNTFDGVIVPGVHPLRIYARYNRDRELQLVADGKIIFDDGLIASINEGKTVSNLLDHRDTDIKALLPP